jgi:hypothetical protein
MSASPNFAGTVNNGTPVNILTGNTALDGTGTTGLIFTAGTGGSFVRRLLVHHRGTNVATVLRVFWNNGSDPAVATNNALVAEKTIPANTLSQTAESDQGLDVILNLPMRANSRLYCSVGTAIAAGLMVMADAGDL